MAAHSADEGDAEGAAYLYRCADRMEQLEDSDDEDSDETSRSAAVHNLAAEDNEFVSAFNRLAQVDAFDRGAFKGAEGLLGDVGALNTIHGVGLRHHVQARIPPGCVQTRVPPGCLFQIPKSELWRAVVLEHELAPRYVPTVGSDAFSDAYPLSTAATNEHEWTRGRLAHKFLEGVAHGLLITPRPVSVQHAGDNVPPDARPVAPPGLGRLVSVLTPVGDHHGVDEAAPGIPFQFWDDDPNCSSTSARYPSTQQVAGLSTDVNGPSSEVAPSAPAPSQLSDLDRRKGKERERRHAALEEHVRSYKAVDVLNRPARLETLDHGRLTMMSGTNKPPFDTGEPGTFTFASDDPDGRSYARPIGFGRGKGGLLTPQPRLRHRALANAPPAADRSYSAATAASMGTLSAPPSTPRYTLPASGMPAQGTSEYITEVAKMAAVENSLRQSSSKRRGKAVDGTSDKMTMSTPAATRVVDSVQGSTEAPASIQTSADVVPESEGTSGVTPPPPSTQADAPAEPRADVQPSTANEAPSIVATVQLESLSERVTIMEQLCEQLSESTDKMNDFDAHVQYVVNTFERTQKAFERTDNKIADVQAETSRLTRPGRRLRGR
jgi:hypothetical protein